MGPPAQMCTTPEVHRHLAPLQRSAIRFSRSQSCIAECRQTARSCIYWLLPVQGISETSPRTAAAVAAVFRELNPDLGASSASVVSKAGSSADSVPAGLEPARAAGGAGSGAVSLEVGFELCLVPILQAWRSCLLLAALPCKLSGQLLSPAALPRACSCAGVN